MERTVAGDAFMQDSSFSVQQAAGISTQVLEYCWFPRYVFCVMLTRHTLLLHRHMSTRMSKRLQRRPQTVLLFQCVTPLSFPVFITVRFFPLDLHLLLNDLLYC